MRCAAHNDETGLAWLNPGDSAVKFSCTFEEASIIFKKCLHSSLLGLGTADAVRRCLWVLDEHPTTEFLVLPGHHLYRMDYQKLIEAHRNSKADITVAASSATTNRDPGFGLLKVDSHNQVLELERETGQYNSNIRSFGSMGIYVINRDAMIRLLREDFPKANEFANEVIPGAISIGMKTDEIHKENIHIPIGIGEGSCIKKAIIDKNARIGKNVKILNIDNVQEGNREDCGYVISSGIVVVLKSAVIQDGTII
ncbi:hypothetical protein GIB67_030997 [Kingdonia uniflora]|uniref:Nucleotidyl transferase domain-containing protein n=1 Tax=Kingdonia uniflora TaxID=39325 RepID=A0A7J7L748_9MAGN|nr:hypothetical protein GIB67_030997 [Kingdonia uniflora]